MTRHLLVTNDFPPKVGGIQAYLWELWRRLPADDVVVYTTPHAGAEAFDAEQPFQVIRSKEPVLLPNPVLRRRVDALAAEVGAEFVLLDPALPVGAIGPSLALPYGVVLHGAEVTVPGRLPASRALLNRVLRGAQVVVAAGGYPAAEAERSAGQPLPTIVVPPGVDTDRFRPLDDQQRIAARQTFGLTDDQEVVLCVSRLVPRKGFDNVVRAIGRLAVHRPNVVGVIAGSGRDRTRLERLATKVGAPVRFVGRVPDDDLPALYGMADVFTMMCRVRWMGLEQEGFGIVFVEAASAGVPQIAGLSGGAHEAVADGVTGRVLDDPNAVDALVRQLDELLGDPALRSSYALASRQRAIEEFSYDTLAATLHDGLEAAFATAGVSDGGEAT